MAITTLDVQRPSPEVARVYLNRPEVRNAFNDGVIAELTQVFGELGRDASLRVIVLGGHGKAFCAGADLVWMRAMADYDVWIKHHAVADVGLMADVAEFPNRHAVADVSVLFNNRAGMNTAFRQSKRL